MLRHEQNGFDSEDFSDEDIFELQHHHLLNCLAKTTVRYLPEIIFRSIDLLEKKFFNGKFEFRQQIELTVKTLCLLHFK